MKTSKTIFIVIFGLIATILIVFVIRAQPIFTTKPPEYKIQKLYCPAYYKYIGKEDSSSRCHEFLQTYKGGYACRLELPDDVCPETWRISVSPNQYVCWSGVSYPTRDCIEGFEKESYIDSAGREIAYRCAVNNLCMDKDAKLLLLESRTIDDPQDACCIYPITLPRDYVPHKGVQPPVTVPMR